MSGNTVLEMPDLGVKKEKIDLSYKHLSFIPIDLIKKCAGLMMLKLDNNKLSKIPPSMACIN